MATSCCAATSSRFVASSSCRARKTRTLAMKNPPSIGLAHHYSSSAGAISSSSSSSISSSISSTRGSILSAPVWATTPSTYSSNSPHRSSSVSLRKFSSDPVLRQRHRSLAAAASAAEPVFGKKSKSPASGALWLEYLRRHAAIITLEDVHAAQQQQSDQSQSTRKQLSAMVAFALCFLASASSSTTGSSSSTSSTTTTSSNQEAPKFTPGGDGGGGGGKLKSTKTKPMFLFSKLQAEKDVQQVQKDATENPYLVSEGIFQGARWTMEDTYKIENGGRFVAVFDGHGGAEVSTVLQERLHELYMEELAKKHWEQQNDFGVERKEIPSKSSHIAALQRGLEQVEDAIMKLDDLVYQGSTAVCVVLHVAKDGKRTLLTANVGDSRAILCRDGKAVDMTRDHKPGDEIERKRIEAMGEEVEWDPYGQVYRVRDLSLSRAIGDRFAKPVVTSEAEIMTFPVSERDDQFVLLASDGLWDVMSSQEVVDYVQEVLTTESQVFSRLDKRKEMARIVANEALERGSADNVCVLVLWLKKE